MDHTPVPPPISKNEGFLAEIIDKANEDVSQEPCEPEVPPMKITLIAMDDRQFETTFDIVRQSNTLRTIIEATGYLESDAQDLPIPVPKVAGKWLEKILAWCDHHKDDAPADPKEDPFDNRNKPVPEWDRDFLNVSLDHLYHILMAVNYLDIEVLYDFATKTVASHLHGKTPEEIRTTFGLRNDFDPGEEERIKEDNAWCDGC